MSEPLSHIKRAYVALVQPTESGRYLVWNGREQAVHTKAVRETMDSPEKLARLVADLKKARFRDWTHNKTVNGILLIGRSAFSGGRLEEGETPKQAAVREVEEEMGLKITEDSLAVLCMNEDKIFYLAMVQSLPPFQVTDEKRSASYCFPDDLIELVETPDNDDRVYITMEMTRLSQMLLGETELTKDFAADMTEWQLAREQPAHVFAAYFLFGVETRARISKLLEINAEIWSVLYRVFPIVFATNKPIVVDGRISIPPFGPSKDMCDEWTRCFTVHCEMRDKLENLCQNRNKLLKNDQVIQDLYRQLQRMSFQVNCNWPKE